MTPTDGLPAAEAARRDAALEALHHAHQRLVRSVDSLPEDQWRAASLLPDWTRAHVVAHLALNGEALAATLEAREHGQVRPVYPSQERRDADIEALAKRDVGEIRERLFAATTRFRDACASLLPRQWAGTVPRLPDGPAWPASDLPATRWREVEIHHADLDLDYSHRDWPADFAADLLDQVVLDHAGGDSEPFSVRADDLGRSWSVGAEEPVVSGTAADLGWWLVGRGHGERLSCTAADLPHLGPWRRASGATAPRS
ncbi:maleylpyruvate isomerase family mycothiol-dependent enzyme [Marmoricola sp. RAF53]|uniref:maleylpyruvate isomerase family mycothiol-dependent enzyme n=1 Tax=Marmoricola sp. RAF53 TaxID=3233059 RepID=UPI003F978E66